MKECLSFSADRTQKEGYLLQELSGFTDTILYRGFGPQISKNQITVAVVTLLFTKQND